MYAWERWYRDEREALDFLLQEEFTEDIMQVIQVTDFEVTLMDEQRNISHVHQQGDGKWKCQRCDRYRCEHVKFVIAHNVQLLPKLPVRADDVEILTY